MMHIACLKEWPTPAESTRKIIPECDCLHCYDWSEDYDTEAFQSGFYDSPYDRYYGPKCYCLEYECFGDCDCHIRDDYE